MPRDDRDTSELTARKKATDAVLDERHRGFDLAAQDTTPKYFRPHFAVVGEGTKSATDAYRDGWERTFGPKALSEGEKDN